jgi:hypothetical protein
VAAKVHVICENLLGDVDGFVAQKVAAEKAKSNDLCRELIEEREANATFCATSGEMVGFQWRPKCTSNRRSHPELLKLMFAAAWGIGLSVYYIGGELGTAGSCNAR